MNIDSAIDRLVLDVAEGTRQLATAELTTLLERISQVGFHPSETERVRGRLSGVVWQGAPGLGVIRESGELRGPQGFDWVLVQYRLSWGHWMTAFQPELGLQELAEPDWSDIPWLRPPTSGSGH